MTDRIQFLSFLLIAGLWVGCASTDAVVTTVEPEPAQAPEAAAPSRPVLNEIPVTAAYRRALDQGTRSADGTPGPRYWTQEATYRMTARLEPEDRRVSGTTSVRYQNNSPDGLGQLRLELAQNMHAEGAVRNVPSEVTGGMQIQRVSIDGATVTEGGSGGMRYEVQGTQMLIHPDQPLSSGASAEIEVEWAFIVPQAGASGRMGYDQDNLFFIAYWYPVMAVYDDVQGWHTAPFRGTAEFYGGFADYDVTIEAPAEWLVHATGELTNPEEVLDSAVEARMREAHASDEPITVVGPEDFATVSSDGEWLSWNFRAEQVRDFAFSATRESIWEAARTPVGDLDGDGEMEYAVVNTLYRETAPFWSEVTEYQQHSIAFLSSYSGLPYPWPHMTAVEGGEIIGGGMEFPMMTLMGDYNLRGQEALYHVTAHELAHMWVPMIVSNNERRYTWMDEGMTTFHENEARADYMPGANHHLGDQAMYIEAARAGLEAPMMQPSDYHETDVAFLTASYAKPAAVIVALREVLGEDVFYEAWQDFISEWAYRHPYPYDFFNTFERVAGRDLDWFWRTWYFETWTLDQGVGGVAHEDGTAVITIIDEGNAPMPVPVTITLQDGEVLERSVPVDVWLEGARQTSIEVEASSPVIRVEIDRDVRLPDIDRENNVWTR